MQNTFNTNNIILLNLLYPYYNQNIMKMILFILMIIQLTTSILVLQRQNITNNLDMGNITNIYLRQKESIYFQTDKNIFGFIKTSTGQLERLFLIESDEYVIKNYPMEIIYTAKHKKISSFSPNHQSIRQLIQINKELQKYSSFSKIKDVLRYQANIYVLTDTFLLQITKDLNSWDDKYQIRILMQNNNSLQQYINLIIFYDKQINGRNLNLISVKIQSNNKRSLCFQRILQNQNQTSNCITLSINQTIQNVRAEFDCYYLQYAKSFEIYDNSFQLIQKFQQKPIDYSNKLLYFTNNKVYNTVFRKIQGQIIIQTQYIGFPFILSIKIQQNIIFVFKDNIKIAQIDIKNQISIRKAWSRNGFQGNNVQLFIQYSDGNLMYYKINDKQLKYQALWSFKGIQKVTNLDDINQNNQKSLDSQGSK